MDNIEKRKFLRLAKKYPLLHSRYIPLELGEKTLVSTTLNIGAGGLLFSSSKRYELSELLKLEIDIPGWQKFFPEPFPGSEPLPSGPFTTKAIVMRVEMISFENYAIAANFVGLDRQELWAIMFAIHRK